MAKASSYIGSDKAVGRLPRFSGKARSSVESKLRNAGFSPSKTSSGSSATWIHPDGSQVRIDMAHRPSSPKTNLIDGKPIMSHVRNHYHKLWSDGINLLSLDDRGYVVASKTANAHIPAKRHKESGFESSLLFEAPFFQESDQMAMSNSSNLGNHQRWLFELPYVDQEYYLDSEADLMFGKVFKSLWGKVTGQRPSSSPPSPTSSSTPTQPSSPFRTNAPSTRTRRIIEQELRSDRETLSQQSKKYEELSCYDRIYRPTIFQPQDLNLETKCLNLRSSMATLKTNIAKLEEELKSVK